MSQDLDETAHWSTAERLPGSASKCAWLTVITGAEAGRVFPLAVGSYLIGRSPEVDIQLSDVAVSRVHTKLSVRDDGTATLVDCASKNGTLLGTRAVAGEEVSLRDGSKIQIGGAVVVRFSFRDQFERSYEKGLYDSATRDHLTGAYNKRHFDQRHQHEFTQAARNERWISLVLFDLDDFKQINDALGHAAGDHVLREVTRLFSTELRETELLARYGGEEFVILMPESDLTAAVTLAERLRRLLQSSAILWKGQRLDVSASFGVASSSGARGLLPDELFQAADECLYRAKRSGKNRVCGPGR